MTQHLLPFVVALFALMTSMYLLLNPVAPLRGLQLSARLLRLLLFEDGFVAQRVNRTDAERIFVAVMNSWSTASVSNGQAVMWDYPTDKDGISITRPTARATSAGIACAGVMAETVAAGSYGLCQVYGYHSAVRARTVTGGTPAIVAGRPLVMAVAGGVWCLESVATASTVILTFPIGFSLGATAGFTTAAIAAFIRAM